VGFSSRYGRRFKKTSSKSDHQNVPPLRKPIKHLQEGGKQKESGGKRKKFETHGYR